MNRPVKHSTADEHFLRREDPAFLHTDPWRILRITGEFVRGFDLLAEIDLAVKEANQAVSHAESIRKFRILPVDFTEDTGELTPTLKVKRTVVAQKFAGDIEALYGTG